MSEASSLKESAVRSLLDFAGRTQDSGGFICFGVEVLWS